METYNQLDSGVYEVTLRGHFTFNDNPEFREVILQKISDPAIVKIILNMRQVEFVDSAALGMLLLAHDKGKLHNKPLQIEGVSGQVKRIFDMARFDQFFVY